MANLSQARPRPQRTALSRITPAAAFALVCIFSPVGGAALAANDSDDRPRAAAHYGFATYYSDWFEGRLTASGRTFDNDAMFAAHPSLPFGTVVRVTNLANRRFVHLRIVDRGPAAVPQARGVIIDVSRAAAERLGFIRAGRIRVRIDIVAERTSLRRG